LQIVIEEEEYLERGYATELTGDDAGELVVN
jgi:hypothetical protein